MKNVNVNTVDMVNIKINGISCCAPAGSTILDAAHTAGIAIPTLCYLKELNAIGACRICVVEVKGAKNLVPACVYPIAEGMEIYTNTEKVQASRRTNLKLILSTHNQTCLTCCRSGNCELQRLCREYGVDNQMAFEGEKIDYRPDDSAVRTVRARPTWSGTTPSASCAAGVPRCVLWPRAWPVSGPPAGASPPTSGPALMPRWTPPPVSIAASA